MLIKGDAIAAMQTLESNSVDMILCDLPYNTTACNWDELIPFSLLWNQYKRICKEDAPIVLTASQPFTTLLISSNMEHYKHSWVWNKKATGNIFLANYQPLKIHEDICVFSFGKCNYYPIKTERHDEKKRSKCYGNGHASTETYQPNKNADKVYEYTDRYPTSIIEFSNAAKKGHIHPTQKPVKLFEYLIQTYSLIGDTVLDNCIGSGTTAIAAINTGRRWIGIDNDAIMIEKAQQRIDQHMELHPMLEKILTVDHDSYWKDQQKQRQIEALRVKYPDPSVAPERVKKLLIAD